MPQFILLLHEPAEAGGAISPAIGPEQMQAVIEKYKTWGEMLASKGHLVGGEKLEDGTGRVLRRAGGQVTVTDGPYVETKELIGGFWRIEAASFDQAAELARDCPHLEYGWVEIRQIENV